MPPNPPLVYSQAHNFKCGIFPPDAFRLTSQSLILGTLKSWLKVQRALLIVIPPTCVMTTRALKSPQVKNALSGA